MVFHNDRPTVSWTQGRPHLILCLFIAICLIRWLDQHSHDCEGLRGVLCSTALLPSTLRTARCYLRLRVLDITRRLLCVKPGLWLIYLWWEAGRLSWEWPLIPPLLADLAHFRCLSLPEWYLCFIKIHARASFFQITLPGVDRWMPLIWISLKLMRSIRFTHSVGLPTAWLDDRGEGSVGVVCLSTTPKLAIQLIYLDPATSAGDLLGRRVIIIIVFFIIVSPFLLWQTGGRLLQFLIRTIERAVNVTTSAGPALIGRLLTRRRKFQLAKLADKWASIRTIRLVIIDRRESIGTSLLVMQECGGLCQRLVTRALVKDDRDWISLLCMIQFGYLLRKR